MLKIPADLILLKGGVLVSWSTGTCLLYILLFSFSHSEVDILLQTQCLSLNFDVKINIRSVRSQNRIERRTLDSLPCNQKKKKKNKKEQKTLTVLINWR